MRDRLLASATVLSAVLALIAGLVCAPPALAAGITKKGTAPNAGAGTGLDAVQHLVVIYEENHSFDNLWGSWPGVDGLSKADQAHVTQVDQAGAPYTCLKQVDVNLTSPPQPADCADAAHGYSSHFPNQPFKIDDYIPSTAKTCYEPTPSAPFGPSNGVKDPNGSPGGCTRDLVHRFYSEQYQIDGGKQDRYTTGSDAIGLTQGYYDTKNLPLYRYLTEDPAAPPYSISDRFFQGAFGGSFLNHQWLVAGQTPVFPNADKSGTQTGCSTGTANCDLHSVVDSNGMAATTPMYAPTGAVKDSQLTEAADAGGNCTPSYPGGAVAAPAGTACGDYAVNTIQPFSQPYSPGTALGKRMPLLTSSNIGDELSSANVSWNWYSGGWDNAAGIKDGPGWTNGNGSSCADPNALASATFPYCPDERFQFHHQPFNYYANYAEGGAGRSHLKDEADFQNDLEAGSLPAVSFVKPIGAENEHPGYTGENQGDSHLVDLIKAIKADTKDWPSTAIVVTYDEFGGAWDHVPVPKVDAWGPGTRIPAMVISPLVKRSADHTTRDTTSILSTIEHRWGLKALSTRDANGNDLASMFQQGYHLVAADGGIFSFGGAGFYGSTGDMRLNKPVVGMAETPSEGGYWMVATDGGIFSFGDAAFFGSTGDIKLNKPIVGMAATPTGKGYWLVASDGGVFSFGDAVFFGSTGDIKLNKPIVAMAPTPSGNGYRLVASDGGIFDFGDADFRGSTGDLTLNSPVIDILASPDGAGYWLLAADGGVFTFGGLGFFGSTGDIRLNKPVVGGRPTPTGHGYWFVASDGGVFTFGDAAFLGSAGDLRLAAPVVAMGH